MLKKVYYLVIAMSVFLTFCSDDILSPEEAAHKRSYNWEVDTLKLRDDKHFVRCCTIGDDLWLMGVGLPDCIWKYTNGVWINYTWYFNEQPVTIFGLDNKELIAISHTSLYKYSEEKWKLVGPIDIPGYKRIRIQNIWAKSESDIYAVGFGVLDTLVYKTISVMLHYNGSEWKLIPSEVRVNSYYFSISPNNENEFLIWGWMKPNFIGQVFRYDGTKVVEVLQDLETSPKVLGHKFINGKTYFLYDDYLSEFKDNQFHKLVDFSNIANKRHYNGRSLKDIFIGTKNELIHYNGEDFKTLFEIGENQYVSKIAIAETIVYILIFDKNLKEYYLHKGKLKY